jgi:hypothetical protein
LLTQLQLVQVGQVQQQTPRLAQTAQIQLLAAFQLLLLAAVVAAQMLLGKVVLAVRVAAVLHQV